jgi:hypothetical protein
MPPAKSAAAKSAAAPEAPVKQIVLQRIANQTIAVPIVGLTPVIPHKWAEKAVSMMRDKQYGLPAQKRAPKNPDEDAEAAMYRLKVGPYEADGYPNGYPGMPATAFKAAMVRACTFFDGMAMTLGRTLIFVEGQGSDNLVRLTGTEQVREDLPRNATGVVDLRYRTQVLAGIDGVEPWKAVLRVTFPPTHITADSIIALADAAGRIGVGDWRPGSPKSNTGVYGTFKVDDEAMAAGE